MGERIRSIQNAWAKMNDHIKTIMLSVGKETIPERTMIFELWGNIGLRKGDYNLYRTPLSPEMQYPWRRHSTREPL